MTGLKDSYYGDQVVGYPNAPGYQRNSDTSRAAAASMAHHFTKQQTVILDWLHERGSTGGTFDEIATGTGLLSQSICGRMVELANARAVIKSIHTRATPSGRQARIYLHKDFVSVSS